MVRRNKGFSIEPKKILCTEVAAVEFLAFFQDFEEMEKFLQELLSEKKNKKGERRENRCWICLQPFD